MRRAKKEARLLLVTPCLNTVIAVVFRGETRIEHLFIAPSVNELAADERFKRVLSQVTLIACEDSSQCHVFTDNSRRQMLSVDVLPSHMLHIARLLCEEYKRLVMELA